MGDLIKYETQPLQTITTVQEGMKYIAKLDVAAAMAKALKLGKEQNEIAEEKVRVYRHMGGIIKDMPKNPGSKGVGKKVSDPDDQALPTLKEQGLTNRRVIDCKKIYEISESAFEQYISDHREDEITTKGLLLLSKEEKTESEKQEYDERIQQPILPGESKTYRVIYADPPWSYGDKMKGSGGAETHYDTMDNEDICSFVVTDQNGTRTIDEIAEDNSVLFMWAVSPLPQEALDVIKAWGFTYKASIVWDKVKHGLGHYVGIRHEFLLIATKGSCLPDIQERVDSVISIERTEHSRKPSEFRQLIDKLYPRGHRVELFAREAPDGWDTFGNEI